MLLYWFIVGFCVLISSVNNVATSFDYGRVDNDIVSKRILSRKIPGHAALDMKMTSAPTANEKCTLSFQFAKEYESFTKAVFKEKYQIVTFRLIFSTISVRTEDSVIGSKIWTWTYTSDPINTQYLSWPFEYGIWSLGILSHYSLYRVLPLHINSIGNCTDLSIGKHETDKLIAGMFARMMINLTIRDDRFNSSRWCYRQVLNFKSTLLYFLCKNIFCPSFVMARQCYRYRDATEGKADVKREGELHTGDPLMIVIPFVLGSILFLFSPLMLMSLNWAVYTSYTQLPKSSKGFRDRSSALEDCAKEDEESQESTSSGIHKEIIFLSDNPPISLTSTLFQPCQIRCSRRSVTVSRIIRFVFPILTLVFVALEVLLDYIYVPEEIQDAVSKGVCVGFRSMLAGFSDSRQSFLPVLGGPYIALISYVVIGSMMFSIPRDLSNFLATGIPDDQSVPTTPLKLDIRTKEKLSAINIRRKIGYYKIYRLLLAHSYMLLNLKFWKMSLMIMKQRFSIIVRHNCSYVKSNCCRYLSLGILFLPYLVFCCFELTIMLIYYVSPMSGLLWVTIRAYSVHILRKVTESGNSLLRCFGYISVAVVVTLFMLFIFMFCTIFLDAFILLARLAMFTYTGVIAFPRLSYGYIILGFTSLYYLLDSVRNFGHLYHTLLKVTISVAESLSKEELDENESLIVYANGLKGIPSKLFEFVIENTYPRRNKVFESMVRFAFTVIVLSVSILLLSKFNRLEDLRLVIHVLFAVFVCAMPVVLGSVFRKRNQMNNKRIRRKVTRVVFEYLRRDSNLHAMENIYDSDLDIMA